jgi:putative ABC transport system ATP-binding protein
MVLADEPTANLDSVTGQAIIELMREINKNDHTTFIFSTHDQRVMDRADRLVRIADGRIAGDQWKSSESLSGPARPAEEMAPSPSGSR